MNGLAFELSGRTAFFKKPDVNEYAYFTYSHIHKIALLGLLGATLGLNGYLQQFESIKKDGENADNTFPEFYSVLHALRVAIVPYGDRGYFSKKIQAFNNGVGYASHEQGGNLIIRQQWLERPKWTIYLMQGEVEEHVYQKLRQMLLQRQTIFIPYLGSNDHQAKLSNVRSVTLEPVHEIAGLDSLFPVENIDYASRGTYGEQAPFYFSEWMPIALNEATNHYIMQELGHTNKRLKEVNGSGRVFSCEQRNLYFI